MLFSCLTFVMAQTWQLIINFGLAKQPATNQHPYLWPKVVKAKTKWVGNMAMRFDKELNWMAMSITSTIRKIVTLHVSTELMVYKCHRGKLYQCDKHNWTTYISIPLHQLTKTFHQNPVVVASYNVPKNWIRLWFILMAQQLLPWGMVQSNLNHWSY